MDADAALLRLNVAAKSRSETSPTEFLGKAAASRRREMQHHGAS